MSVDQAMARVAELQSALAPQQARAPAPPTETAPAARADFQAELGRAESAAGGSGQSGASMGAPATDALMDSGGAGAIPQMGTVLGAGAVAPAPADAPASGVPGAAGSSPLAGPDQASDVSAEPDDDSLTGIGSTTTGSDSLTGTETLTGTDAEDSTVAGGTGLDATGAGSISSPTGLSIGAGANAGLAGASVEPGFLAGQGNPLTGSAGMTGAVDASAGAASGMTGTNYQPGATGYGSSSTPAFATLANGTDSSGFGIPTGYMGTFGLDAMTGGPGQQRVPAPVSFTQSTPGI